MAKFGLSTILGLFPLLSLLNESLEDSQLDAKELSTIINVVAKALKLDIKLVEITEDGKLVLQLPTVKLKRS